MKNKHFITTLSCIQKCIRFSAVVINKKIIFGLFILSFLNACAAPTALLGPTFTFTSTGSALQTGFSYGSGKIIEKHTNTKIREIFLNQGENQFREIEENIIKQILDSKEKKVIALGGGSFESKNIRELVKGINISIWLKCNINILVERLKKNKNRPLLIGKNIKSEIMKLDKIRKINYESANFHYDVSKKQKKIILKELVEYIESIV